MNIQCTICSDFINPAENIYVTKCGHLFHYNCLYTWIERSKSCPQCRHRITPKCMFRVFPNTPDGSPSGDENVESLTMKLDHSKLKIRQQEQEIKGLRDDNMRINMDLEAFQKEISALKMKIVKIDTQVVAVRQQMGYLQAENKKLKDKEGELETYKQNAQIMQGLQNILNSTTEEVNLMLQNYSDIRVVSVFAVALKKALAESEQQKNLLRNRLQTAKQEQAEGKIKFDELQEKFNALMKDYELEKKKCKTMKEDNVSRLDDSWCLNTSKLTPPVQKANETSIANTSLNTLVNKIENADSPYLNLKQSSLAWAALKPSTSTTAVKDTLVKNLLKCGNYKLPTTTKVSGSDMLGKKFAGQGQTSSIFQTNEPALPEFYHESAQSKSEMDISYDGLGGHSKFSDEFPKPKVLTMRTYSKTLTDKHRLKRPNPAGTQNLKQMLKKLRDQ